MLLKKIKNNWIEELTNEGFVLAISGDDLNKSLTCYPKDMKMSTKLNIQKLLNKIDISNYCSEFEIAEKFKDTNVTVENFTINRTTLLKEEASGNLTEILKYYPSSLVKIIKGDVNGAIEDALKKVDDANGAVWAVDNFGSLFYNKKDVSHQSITLVKCIQKGEEENIYNVGLTFTKIDVQLTKERALFVCWESGKKSVDIRSLDLLIDLNN